MVMILVTVVTIILDELKRDDIAKLIIDMRNNPGGNSAIMSGMITDLLANTSYNQGFDQKGRLFVLIGRGTFSSAVLNSRSFGREPRRL